MRVVGLTGGIASGKSFVSSLFETLGAFIIDADEVYHRLLETEEITTKIGETFGLEFFNKDCKVDRKKLGRLVFSDPKSLEALNFITHPAVIREIDRILNDAKARGKALLFILSVPLLFEVGFDKEVEETIVVSVNRATQIDRLCKRSNLSMEEAIKRIDSQMPLSEKETRASFIIHNGDSRSKTEEQVAQLYKKLTDKKS